MNRKYKEKIEKEIVFLSDHWTTDDKKPFNFGGWKQEVVDNLVNIMESYAEQRMEEAFNNMKCPVSKDHKHWCYKYADPEFDSKIVTCSAKKCENKACKFNILIDQIRTNFRKKLT